MRDAEEDEEEEEDDDEDSDDDNVQIVIDQGKIEEAKTTATFGIKPSSRQIPSERRGRFNVEDFDQVGQELVKVTCSTFAACREDEKRSRRSA